MSLRQLLVLVGVALALLVVGSAVADPPNLSVPSSVTSNVDGPGPYPVTYSVSATDENGTPTIVCNPPSGSDFAYGDTTVTCTATDPVDLTTSPPGIFTVTVVDTTAPSVSVPASFAVEVVGLGTTAVVSYPAATASDAGTPVTPTCSPASGTTFAYGATPVVCSVSDTHGNTGTGTFTVTVHDTTPPIITPPANVTATVAATPATVTYPAATATEGVVPTCSPASGSSFPNGVTTVTCNATDAAGNAAVPKTFTVTVVDHTPPTVTITGGTSGVAGSSGATFDFTTTEGSTFCQLDGQGFAPCSSPANYSGQADGPHTFQVKAVDAAGNTSAIASRSWTIDTTPPTLTLPAALHVEADSPSGSVVTFNVSASDGGAALVPSAISCTPASGTLFPLGETTVTCMARDSLGHVGSGKFSVVVQDTTPPTINAPNVSFTATSAAGIRKASPQVGAYLAGVTASDLVSTPTLTNDMPDVLPIGKTTIVFTATDAAGNSAKKSVTVTVLPVGKKAPPPDLTPPGNVVGAKAVPGDRSVALSWRRPSKDVTHVVVTQLVVGQPGAGHQIFDGAGTAVTAKGLVNGTTYRFLIVAYDAAGNRSKGVIVLATPKAEALTSPATGQRVTKPALLRWVSAPGAAYYNVQLWHGSEKVLSTWPTTTSLQLTSTWTFGGKAQKLTAGLYTWYVWPGIGPRADARYGSLLGSRTFFYAPPKSKPKPKK
jgi:hypothetical protein